MPDSEGRGTGKDLPHDLWLRLRLTALGMSRAEYVEQLIARDLRDPVLVWQMGKVASRSFVEAIERTGDYAVFHFHHIGIETINELRAQHDQRREEYPPNLKLSIQMLEVIDAIREAADRRVRIVSAVRDPLARNISAFFQNLTNFVPGDGRHDPETDAERLTEAFLDRYPHSIPLAWFDQKIKATLGMDIYATPFDSERARLRSTEGAFDLLVLRAEDDDAAKEAALNEFFARDGFEIVRTNVGSSKDYAELYEAFLERLVIPEHLLDTIYESRLCRHFYSEGERAAMRARWRTSRAPS
jgi:hypothetical protein